MVKIALENQPETRWIGVMLGAGKRIEEDKPMAPDTMLEAPAEDS
jgi:hypothetical protein